MKKSRITFTHISNIVCFVLLLAMLATQFMPFWLCADNCKTHKGEEKMVSLAEYTWFPKKHSPITKEMTNVYLEIYGKDYKDENGKKFKFQPNDAVVPTIIVFAAVILSIVMLIKYAGKPLTAILPFAAGLAGTIGFLTIPALQVGQNWTLHLIVSIALAAAAGGSLVFHFVKGTINFVKALKGNA